MTPKQKQKILDVMHTLGCIQTGIANNPKVSAKSCRDVLIEVLDLDETPEGETI